MRDAFAQQENKAVFIVPSYDWDKDIDILSFVEILPIAIRHKQGDKNNASVETNDEETCLALVGTDYKLDHIISDLIYFDPNQFPELVQSMSSVSSKLSLPYVFLIQKDSGDTIFHPVWDQANKKNFVQLNSLAKFCFLQSLTCEEVNSEGSSLFRSILSLKHGNYTTHGSNLFDNDVKEDPTFLFDSLKEERRQKRQEGRGSRCGRFIRR